MNFRRHRRERIELNMAPLIDVVFLLLIFFAVTTTFEREAALKIQLPQAQGQRQERRGVEIAVDAQGRYYCAGRLLPDTKLETLERAIAKALEEGARPALVIAADRQTPHQAVIRVLDAARRLNVKHVAFATQDAQE